MQSTSSVADCPLRLDQRRVAKGRITGSIRFARAGKRCQGLLASIFAKFLLRARDCGRRGLMMEQGRSTLRCRRAGGCYGVKRRIHLSLNSLDLLRARVGLRRGGPSADRTQQACAK
jgi:hypothetical protein